MYICPACGGDGIETCNNPDHGFIAALDFHEVGRLGCPCCGHHPEFKMQGVCDTCNGSGQVDELTGMEYLEDNNIDNELSPLNHEHNG